MSEELMVRHCSPTLAGIKTANLISCRVTSKKALYDEIRRLNRRLGRKGLRIFPLKVTDTKALIYVYRPAKLIRDLADPRAYELMRRFGYDTSSINRCLMELSRRLSESDEFPHEIGLFLGYPPEDVEGFIDNNAEGCKFVGIWKVYGDEIAARKLFEKYRKCTAVYTSHWQMGKPVERLTVAG